MNHNPPLISFRRACVRALLVAVPAALYTTLLWFRPGRDWPVVKQVLDFSRFVYTEYGLSSSIGWAIKSILLVALAVAVVNVCVSRRYMLHRLRLEPQMRNLLFFSLAVAFPVQVALGASPGMHLYYRNFFMDGGNERILANALVIITEHFWIEGVVLGLALPAGLLATLHEVPRIGRLARVGLGFPADGSGDKSLWSWLGIPRLAVPAIVAQGVLFFMIHWSKDPFEVATSLPGGMAVGWLSVRSQSFVPAMVLHLVTGSVVLVTMMLTR